MKKQIHIVISEFLFKEIEELRIKQHRSMSNVIECALLEYIEKYKGEKK